MTKIPTEAATSPIKRCQQEAGVRSRSLEAGNEPLTIRYIALAAGVAVVWVGLWLAFITRVLAALIG